MELTTKITKLEDTLKVQTQLLALAPELAKGKVFECRIKPYKEKRSLDANAYFHVLVDKIAKVLNCGADEIKVKLNLDYGTVAVDDDGDPVIVPLPKNVEASTYYPYAKWLSDFKAKNGRDYSQYLFYKQTHTLTTKEMATLIDGVVAEAKGLGIETKTPEELANMKSLWGTCR